MCLFKVIIAFSDYNQQSIRYTRFSYIYFDYYKMFTLSGYFENDYNNMTVME